MLSPFLAWFLRSAKISSCLRIRLAPSTSFLDAISSSSPTCRFLRSDRCINLDSLWIESGEEGGETTPASGIPVSGCGAGWKSSGRLRGKFAVLDVAVNKRGQLGFGQGADLGGFDGAVLEKHERGYAADAVLGRRGLVLVDVELGDLEPPGIFLRHLVEDGGDHLAGAAPFRPVVHEHRRLRLQDLGIKSLVRHVMDVFSHATLPSGIVRKRHGMCGSRTCPGMLAKIPCLA